MNIKFFAFMSLFTSSIFGMDTSNVGGDGETKEIFCGHNWENLLNDAEMDDINSPQSVSLRQLIYPVSVEKNILTINFNRLDFLDHACVESLISELASTTTISEICLLANTNEQNPSVDVLRIFQSLPPAIPVSIKILFNAKATSTPLLKMIALADINIASCQLECTETKKQCKKHAQLRNLLIVLAMHTPELAKLSLRNCDYLHNPHYKLMTALKDLPALKTIMLKNCRIKAPILTDLIAWKNEFSDRELIQERA